MNINSLSAPPGPIQSKYDLVRMAGEPNFPSRWGEIWSVGDVNTGKTTSLLDASFISLEHYSGSRILWMRNSFEDLKDSIIPAFEARFAPMFEEKAWRWKGDTVVRAPNPDYPGDRGAMCKFVGIDYADNTVWGTEWFRGFLSQGELVKQRRINTLHQRLARLKVPHLFERKPDGSPIMGKSYLKLDANWSQGKNYMYQRVIAKGYKIDAEGDIWERYEEKEFKGGRWGRFYYLMVQSRTEENLSVSDDYLGHMLASADQMDDAIIGGWTDTKGLVIGLKYNERMKINRPTVYRDHVGLFSVDHGIGHPTAILIGIQDRAGRVKMVKEIVRADYTASENARDLLRVIKWMYNQGVREWYGFGDPSMWRRESNGKSSADYYNEVFAQEEAIPISFVRAYSRKETAINTKVSIDSAAFTDLSEVVQNHRFFVAEDDCYWLTKAIKEGTWEDIQKDTLFLCDVLNALGYLAMNIVIPYAVPEDDPHRPLNSADLEEMGGASTGKPPTWGWGRR